MLLRPRPEHQQSGRGQRLQILFPRSSCRAALLVSSIPCYEARKKVIQIDKNSADQECFYLLFRETCLFVGLQKHVCVVPSKVHRSDDNSQ